MKDRGGWVGGLAGTRADRLTFQLRKLTVGIIRVLCTFLTLILWIYLFWDGTRALLQEEKPTPT